MGAIFHHIAWVDPGKTTSRSVLLHYDGQEGDLHYYIGRDTHNGVDVGISVVVKEIDPQLDRR